MKLKIPSSFIHFAVAAGVALIATAFMPAFAHADRGQCGQPASNGHRPAAVDALKILKTSVGQGLCSNINDGDDSDDNDDSGDGANCPCDVDTSGSVTTRDSLAVLRSSVGIHQALHCNPHCQPESSTTTTEENSGNTTTTLGNTTTTLPGITTTTLQGLPGVTTTTLGGISGSTTTTILGGDNDDDDDDQGDIDDNDDSGGDQDDAD